MDATYVDLHIHTSENADKLNKNYNIETLLNKITETSKGHKCLISLTDHNTINKEAYLELLEKKSDNISVVLGTELHIRNYEGKPAYHCHIYFDVDEISENVINDINSILNYKYPIKMVEKRDKSIPKIEEIINIFEDYDFILIPHGGQGHATFDTSISKDRKCDDTIERTIYYNQIEGFSARSNSGLEETKKYLKRLGISDFVNLITGTDNYDPTKYPEPKSDKAEKFIPTWIYTTPNFKGLRLALSEASRIEYADEPTIDDYSIIENIELKNEKIEINTKLTQGLNVIIGESSSGKSLFVDSIYKKITNKVDECEYEEDFEISKMKIEDGLGAEPYYIEQNFIAKAIRNRNELNTIPIIKDLFPEEEYNQNAIEVQLTQIKKNLNNLVKSIKKVESSYDKIKKVPSINNLLTKGEVSENHIQLFEVSDDVLEKIKYTKEDLATDIKQIKEIKNNLIKNPLYQGNINNFDEIIKELMELNKKYKFEEKIRKIINKYIKKYDIQIRKTNSNNSNSIKNKQTLIKSIASYISGTNEFYKHLQELLKIDYEIKSIEREFEGNKLYIINNLKISEEILLDSIKTYINNRKVKISTLSSLKPKDLFKENFVKNKAASYEEFTNNIYNDIASKDKKTYKVIDYNGNDFDKLSPGWKTAIILDIMLKYDDDNAPLIIDQPEDNLANSYINGGLIDTLKRAKLNKQILIVSHNATIPMLGDAQNIVLCRNEGNKIRIVSEKLEGDIDGKPVIDYIAEITDGGKKAIKKRFKKYNFKKYKEEE
ncbi:MAG: ATPase [Clostridia bacterium]|nr:ATPase [Clostridia bacterium]